MNDKERFAEALKNLEKRFGESTRLGGKGTQKRKVKVQHKPAGDDKKVKNLVKKMGAQPMPDISEMNFFLEDNTYWNFKKPEVYMSFQNQIVILSGDHEVKSVRENLAEVVTQISPEQLEQVRSAAVPSAGEEAAPELVNFEEVAKAN